MIRVKQHIFILLGLAVLCLQSASADSWQIIASPNGSRQVNELHSVSALAENDVWAVGVSYNTERTLGSTLIEHWNGSRWSVVPSPNPSSTLNVLNAVAAVSANDVWAVGIAPTGSDPILIVHWNGNVWSVVPNPTSNMPLNNLAALAVVSANDVWAVGTGLIGDEDATTTLHWNGTAWSVIPSPNVGPEVDNSLAGVTAVASNDVWAVGTQQPTSLTAPHTLVLHWNGAAWTIVPSPNDGGNTVRNHLLAAAAAASNDVWASGFSGFGTLTEHWDGTSWSIVQTPDIRGSEPLFLPSVVALGSNNVWAVGEFFQTRFSRSRTLTEQWNGTSWVLVQSPNSGADHNELFGVDATPGGTLWAVGTVYHYPRQQTLIERKLP
jgi:hypothetical protein